MPLIKAKAPSAVFTGFITDFSSKTIVCDISISIYKFLIATNYGKNSKVLKDPNGNHTAHLVGILNNVLLYKANNISPV